VFDGNGSPAGDADYLIVTDPVPAFLMVSSMMSRVFLPRTGI